MFKDMKMGLRLGLGFGVILLSFLTAVVITMVYLNGAEKSAIRVQQRTTPSIMRIDRMDLNIVAISDALTDASATHQLTDDFNDASKMADSFRQDAGTFKEMFTKGNDLQSAQDIDDLVADFNQYYANGVKMAHAYVEKGIGAGNAAMTGFDGAREQMMQVFGKFQKRYAKEARVNTAATVTAVGRIRTAQIILVSIAMLLVILISVAMSRDLLRQLGDEPRVIADIARKIADGDLTMKFSSNRVEIGIYSDIKRMAEKLLEVVTDVKSAAENVAAGSQQLSSGSQQLSQGATEQAAAAEEASSSMDEMA
ncbi:MAG: hypothetical protein M0Z75_08725, partial [Nitrospiraceae bacterium]|nr:hypothetical protein [Nitrospiraceae bacterium]